MHWKGSDTESETEADSGKIWTGHYRFSLDLLPGNPGLGWILGGGRNDMNDQGVDYLLTLQKKQHHVHGRHARFAHHPESGVFMLTVDAGKMVLVNGKERVEGARQAIATVDTGLSVGDLGYRLEFTRLHEKRYREQLTIFRESLGGWLSEGANKEPPRSLEITPSENHYEYHGFIIQSPFGAGGYGMVSPGIEKSTGKAVAVKRLKRTSKSMARIWLEVKIYKEIGDHVRLITTIEIAPH